MALISRWTLDNTPNDLLGNNNGTVSGTVVYDKQCVVGTNSMICDGGADYIDLGSFRFSGKTNYSISVWFRWVSSGDPESLVSDFNNDNNSWVRIVLYLGKIYYQVRNVGSDIFNSSTTVSTYNDNKWHHLVICDANGTVTSYVDGVSSDISGSYTRAALTLHISSIGRGTSEYHIGNIDDVRYYDHILPQAEVTELWLGRIPRWQTPISRWSLDGNANDYYGLYNGTASNVTYSTPDKKFGSQSGVFNGSSSYVNLGNYAGLVPSTITISAWVKLTATGANVIYDKDGDGSNRGFYVQILNGYIDISCGGNLPITRTGRTNLVNDGNWHHIVATGGTSIAWATYIDGKLDMTGSTMSAVNATTVNGSIGKGSYPGQPNYFTGSLDDVRFYDVALTADEVMNLYKSYATPIWQQPLHHWKLDGDATDSAGDKSGTASGTIAYSASVKVFGSQALNCDGGADYINLGSFRMLSYAAFSISVWVKYSGIGNKGIISQCTSSSDAGFWRLITSSGDGQLYLQVLNDAGGVLFNVGSGVNCNDNVWHHVVIIDNNGTVSSYIDGKLCGISGSYTRTTINSNNSSLAASLSSTNIYYFTGGMDDVRFYDVALSAADVRALYNSYFTEKASNFMSIL